MFGLNQRYLKDFDWPLLVMALALAIFGIVEIWSAEPSPGLWRRQLFGLGIGLAVLFTVTLVDYRRVVNLAPWLYLVGIVCLILVLTPLGEVVNGNKSWLNLGFIRFQPSEIAKLFTLLFLAWFLGGVKQRPLGLWPVLVACAIWAVPTLLVFMENDTGSALSFSSFLAAVLFLGGIRWSWMIAALLGLVLVIVLAVPKVKECKSYKCERIKAVYWPELADKRYRYQNEQSEIAVGSGGLFGKGPGNSTQGTLGFVPEVHNDFIYAVASEETGFVGSALSLALYLLMIMRLLQIARRARERSGMLLVGGYAALLLYHVTVNIGMVIRLLPVMGIPLPLMSFGSTSVLATCLGLGLAISVRLKRFVN